MTTRASARLAGISAFDMPPPPPVKKSKKTPAAKSKKTPAAPKKRVSYGQAKFFEKTTAMRKNEASAKKRRELEMVESPFKAEVPDRIKLLKGLKKMIQKIVTGAEAKRCPKKNPGCTNSEMVKGPYLVSLATVQKLEKIIRLTPHDGPIRGKRMLKLKQERVDANAVRRGMIAKIVAERLTLNEAVAKNNPFSKMIQQKDVSAFKKRKSAAARAAVTRTKKQEEGKRVLHQIINGTANNGSIGNY